MLKQRCHFQRQYLQRWATSKQRCEYDHLKKTKLRFKNKIIFLNFKEYVGFNIFLHFFPILTLHDGAHYHVEAQINGLVSI